MRTRNSTTIILRPRMAITYEDYQMPLPNVKVTANQWVNLYSESGADTAKAIRVQNVTPRDMIVTSLTSEPQDFNTFNVIPPYETWVNDVGDGAWAYQHIVDGACNVEEI